MFYELQPAVLASLLDGGDRLLCSYRYREAALWRNRQNFANPAITARIVLLVSFATPMTTWPLPNQLMGVTDAVTGPTPLGIMNMGGDAAIPSNIDMFLGFVGGSLGETSAIALILGGIYLVARKVIEPTIPVAFIGTVFVLALLAGQDPIFLFAQAALCWVLFSWLRITPLHHLLQTGKSSLVSDVVC